jgi:hypothetical protein
MVNTRRLGKMGIWAVGVGFGAAMASTGVASADTAGDITSLFSAIDPFGAAASMTTGVDDPSSPFDFAYSINGVSYDYGTATATTTAGTGDVALAFGNDASASATVGTDDFALADGTHALADSGGATGANYDSAIDIGSTTNTTATVVPGTTDGAFSGASSFADGPTADVGTNDFALVVGNLDGTGDTATAVGGANDSATVFGDQTGNDLGALASFGQGDIASVSGMNDAAAAYYGTHDVATVVGSEGSTAISGTAVGDNNDLASVFFDNGATATATGGSNLVDVLPTADTTFVTDLASLFDPAITGTASSLADILPSSFDGLGSMLTSLF